MWYTGTYHDTYHTYVAHAVGDDGQLGPAHVREFTEFDPERVAVDVGSDRDVFYKGTETGGLTAHLVQPDGSLEQMGASHLCGAIPLVAVRGFLFAPGPEETVCSFEGPRLAYRGTSELRADYPYYAVALALRDGASSSSPTRRPAALVAMTTSSRTVRVFAMSDDGGLEPLDTVEPGYTRWMLFHPSGRFLYVSHGSSSADSPLGLTVYSIDADGHLAVLQTLEGGGGTMAVTLPQFPAGASAR
jgi:hypothetical protein